MAKPFVAYRAVTRRATIMIILALGALASFGVGQVLGHPHLTSTPTSQQARTDLARVGSAHGALIPTPTRPLARAAASTPPQAHAASHTHGTSSHKGGNHDSGNHDSGNHDIGDQQHDDHDT